MSGLHMYFVSSSINNFISSYSSNTPYLIVNSVFIVSKSYVSNSAYFSYSILLSFSICSFILFPDFGFSIKIVSFSLFMFFDKFEYKKAIKNFQQLYLLDQYKNASESLRFKWAIGELLVRY